MDLRIANNVSSGVAIATGAAGGATAGAILAGCAVVPVIGWAIALVGVGVLVTKITINYTVKPEAEKKLKKLTDLIDDLQKITCV
jgi:CHASE2 domain-containing sensor protein